MRGGAFYFRIAQYMDLVRARGDAVLVFYPAPDGSTFVEKLSVKQIVGKAFFWFSRFLKFSKDLIASDTVIIFPSPIFWFYCLLARMCRKRIVVEHIVSYISHRDVFQRYPFWLDQLAFSLSDVVITHTESMKEDLLKRFSSLNGKIKVAYCELDLQQFSVRYSLEAQKIKDNLGITDKKIVFYHGMHHTWHAYDLVIKAAELLESKRKDIIFVLLPGKTQQLVERKGNVIHLREEGNYSWETLPHYIQIADLWVSGFRCHERGDRSFGSTLIQALAMARPIITSPSREKNKFLTDGRNVFFVGTDSAATIADKIVKCLNEPKKMKLVAQGAREIAEKFFSIDGLKMTLGEAIEVKRG